MQRQRRAGENGSVQLELFDELLRLIRVQNARVELVVDQGKVRKVEVQWKIQLDFDSETSASAHVPGSAGSEVEREVAAYVISTLQPPLIQKIGQFGAVEVFAEGGLARGLTWCPREKQWRKA